MNPFSTTEKELPERLVLAAVALWSLLILTIGILAVLSQRQTLVSIAYREALAAFHDDVTHRAWIAQQGGVYAPITENLPPNPYLAGLPERDVTTTTGIQLTLINPAYMTRMVYDLGKEKLGIQRHLTSLNPIRPENAADARESNETANNASVAPSKMPQSVSPT